MKSIFPFIILFLMDCGFSLSCLGTTNPKWEAFHFTRDRAPINLSHLLDAPAGKHGFLDIRNKRFVFEDGTPARFWGTTMAGAACFPPQDKAPLLAERLSQMGFNLVRFEHMDAAWANLSIFQLTPFQTLEINPVALDRLDYFIFQLKNRGIYCYLSCLDSRQLQRGENLPFPTHIPPGFKSFFHFVPRLRQLHKDFLFALWSHRNPYTELDYRDSPEIVMTDPFAANPCRPFNNPPPFYLDRLRERWRIWAREEKLERIPILDPGNIKPIHKQFLTDLVKKSGKDMRAFLRSIGVKCPIGASSEIQTLSDLPKQEAMEYTAVQRLWNPPSGRNWIVPQEKMSSQPWRQTDLFSEIAFGCLDSQPFVVSKWGCPWPNPYRAEVPLWFAAMALFQDWDHCIAATYSSQSSQELDHIPDPREAHADPCVAGLYPAAAILFHANEIRPSRESMRMAFDESLFYQKNPITPLNALTPRLAEKRTLRVSHTAEASGPAIYAPTEPGDISRFDSVRDGLFYRDDKTGIVVIDTPTTKAIIGRVAELNGTELTHVEIVSREEFAVICVSSLDGKPIHESRDLWVTVVSQAQNTGFQTETYQDLQIVRETGTAPILRRSTPARLFIRSSHARWDIWAVGGGGEHLDSLPFQIQDGTVSFRIGIHGVMYYRAQARKD